MVQWKKKALDNGFVTRCGCLFLSTKGITLESSCDIRSLNTHMSPIQPQILTYFDVSLSAVYAYWT